MALLGIRDIIKASEDDLSINPLDDALAVRYLTASLSNAHISAHIAANYAGRGRAAYKWLDSEYGLSTMRQSELRAELTKGSWKRTPAPHL